MLPGSLMVAHFVKCFDHDITGYIIAVARMILFAVKNLLQLRITTFLRDAVTTTFCGCASTQHM
jgi:hypothetical protein